MFCAFAGEHDAMMVAARVFVEQSLLSDGSLRATFAQELLRAWSSSGGIAMSTEVAVAGAALVWRLASARFGVPLLTATTELISLAAVVISEQCPRWEAQQAALDVRDSSEAFGHVVDIASTDERARSVLRAATALRGVLVVVDLRLTHSWDSAVLSALPRALQVIKEYFVALPIMLDDWIDVSWLCCLLCCFPFCLAQGAARRTMTDSDAVAAAASAVDKLLTVSHGFFVFVKGAVPVVSALIRWRLVMRALRESLPALQAFVGAERCVRHVVFVALEVQRQLLYCCEGGPVAAGVADTVLDGTSTALDAALLKDRDVLWKREHPTLPRSVAEARVIEALRAIACETEVRGADSFGDCSGRLCGELERPVTIQRLLVAEHPALYVDAATRLEAVRAICTSQALEAEAAEHTETIVQVISLRKTLLKAACMASAAAGGHAPLTRVNLALVHGEEVLDGDGDVDMGAPSAANGQEVVVPSYDDASLNLRLAWARCTMWPVVEVWCLARERSIIGSLLGRYWQLQTVAAGCAFGDGAALDIYAILHAIREFVAVVLAGSAISPLHVVPYQKLVWKCEAAGDQTLCAVFASSFGAQLTTILLNWHVRSRSSLSVPGYVAVSLLPPALTDVRELVASAGTVSNPSSGRFTVNGLVGSACQSLDLTSAFVFRLLAAAEGDAPKLQDFEGRVHQLRLALGHIATHCVRARCDTLVAFITRE